MRGATVAAASVALHLPAGHPLARRRPEPAAAELRVLWPAHPAGCVDAAAHALAGVAVALQVAA